MFEVTSQPFGTSTREELSYQEQYILRVKE
jgi:hypothetical protein